MNFIYFSLGIIFLQLVYIAIHYLLFRQKEFLYFSFFSISITVICVLRIFPYLNPYYLQDGEERFSSFYGLVLIAYAMYYKFLRIFLETKILYPLINRFFILCERIFIPIGVLILLLGFFSFHQYSKNIFFIVYILALPFFLISIIYIGTRKRTINRIIAVGIFLSFIIARYTAAQNYILGKQNFELVDFQYFIAALVVLLIVLNLGILYKSKLIVDQNIQLEVKRQSELNQQREMISADLHDDLGASLSSILLNASMVQKNLNSDQVKANSSLSRMMEDLKLVIENMGDIIWAINSNKKAPKSISGQLKDFYFDLMDGHGIECNYHIDHVIEEQITNINARKNLLLIAKEAINNILKHAKSTQIDVFLIAKETMVLLEIKDNGKGMKDPESNLSGNGIRNMKYRTEKINGIFKINSEVGIGTTITCFVPLTNIRYFHSEAV